MSPLLSLALFIILVFIAFLVFLHLKVSSGTKHTDTFGSAHLATMNEVSDLLPSRVALQSEEPFLPLGTSPYGFTALSVKRQESHVLLVAPTGQGKTSGVIIPGLLVERGHRSLFINDTKFELVGQCLGWLARSHTCFVLSPTRSQTSHHYNPLAHVEDMEDAEDLAACIVTNTGESTEPFWNNASQLLLTACILHIKATEPHPPFSALVNLLTATKLPDLQVLLLNSPSSLARSAATSFLQSLALNERLSGSIMVELSTRLFSMNNPALVDVTSTDDINFDAFITRPTALFLSIPASQAKRLKWLSASIMMQLIKHLTKRAEESIEKRLPRSIALYLDEFGNQIIPHFPEYISLVRSAGISFILAIQSHGQLTSGYQEEGKNTILANATTHIVFPGCGLPETTYYSERLGDMTVQTLSRAKSGLTSTTVTHGQAGRRLMTSDEIRRLPTRNLVVITENIAPLLVVNHAFFEVEEMKQRAGLPYNFPHRVPQSLSPPVALPPVPQGPQPQNTQNWFLP